MPDSHPNLHKQEAIALMLDFAERTGLTSERAPQRYLWTDAFAVCNLVGLARATGEARYTELALRLVDHVHHTLARHRGDDSRTGWISGLDEREGEAHPTRGGLRIGKGLRERGPNEPFDEEREWDRDGQYFHYLTKWMHALDQVTRATRQPQFNVWARELAETAQRVFTYPAVAGAHRRGMYWKMSIDLTRPLVSAMGQHDPLDGYVTCVQLRSTAAGLPGAPAAPGLEDEIRRYAAMIETGEWATTDALGLGGLLSDAWRLDQLQRQGAPGDARLLHTLLTAALAGLRSYVQGGELRQPAEYRLAFRELGLAIGLRALERLWHAADAERSDISPQVRARLQALMQYSAIGTAIESYWRAAEHRQGRVWSEHRDINEVMLATSLVPDGFLALL
jgi:hypothetical protein